MRFAIEASQQEVVALGRSNRWRRGSLRIRG